MSEINSQNFFTYLELSIHLTSLEEKILWIQYLVEPES